MKREFYLIDGTWGLWCSCAFLAWRMGSGRYPHVQISAHTLGRMLMQPKAEFPLSLNEEKNLLQISSVVLATSLYCLWLSPPAAKRAVKAVPACCWWPQEAANAVSATGPMTTMTGSVKVILHPTQLVPSPPGSIAALLWDAPAACSKNKRNPKIVIDLLSDKDNYISNTTMQNTPAISSICLSSVFWKKKTDAILVSHEINALCYPVLH